MTTELTSANPTENSVQQLAQALRDYHQSFQDLGDYKAKADSAQAEQEAALASDGSDDQVAAKIAKSEAMKQVYSVRTKFKETELQRRTSELERLYPLAVRELNAQIGEEIDKRKALIITKATESLEVASDLGPFEVHAVRAGIAELTRYSGPVREIASLRPSMNWSSPGNGAAISTIAGTLLANLEKFKDMTSK